MLSYRYEYDRNGNRVGVENLVSGEAVANQTNQMKQSEIPSQARTTMYSYDSMQRLSSVQYPNAITEQYAYDNVGNRVLKRCGEFETRYRYNNRNQLVHSNVFGAALQRQQEERWYEYDLQGNLMHESVVSFLAEPETKSELVEERAYEYDTLNRTSHVQIQRGEGESTQKNFYDAEGMRCGVEENGEVTNFITDGWSIVAELDKEYNVKRRLVRGYGIVASEVGTLKDGDKQSARYRFYHNNEHTDVIMLTDIDGKVVNHYEYDAFGKRQSICEQEENRYGYTSEVYDNVTEQYYLRARFYNPTVARFTQEDEYRGDGLNLYAYCGNNPVMYADPSGYKKSCKNTGVDGADSNSDLNRKEALNMAKDRADIPRSQQPTRQWTVGDDINRKGFNNYVYDPEQSHQGRYYEYDTPNGKRVIVDHINDSIQGSHTHAGMPKGISSDMNYDFKTNRYMKIVGTDGDHHIRYK